MLIREVDEISVGSEMSDLLIERLRAATTGSFAWDGAWKVGNVGVFVADGTGEGRASEGVGFTENAGEGRGVMCSTLRVGCRFAYCCDGSKYPFGVITLLLRERGVAIIGEGMGDGWKLLDAPGDFAVRRVLGTLRSSYPLLELEMPSAIACAKSSL